MKCHSFTQCNSLLLSSHDCSTDEWTTFVWPTIESSGRLLWTFKFHTTWGISSPAEDLLAFKRFYFMQLVNIFTCLKELEHTYFKTCYSTKIIQHWWWTNKRVWITDGIITSGEKQSTQMKICPSATCPPQIPHKVACDKTQVSAARNQQLTTSAMA